MTRWFRPRPERARAVSCLLLVALALASTPALALELEVTHSGPSLVGEGHTFTAVVTDAMGDVTFEWRFGEGDYEPGSAVMSHTFTEPGLYSIDAIVTDGSGLTQSVFFRHLVHYPLTTARPTSSSPIVYDPARKRVYSVNQDNDTITSIDAEGLVKLGELLVYRKPESLALTPAGKLWVVHQDDYAVALVDPDTFSVERGFRLPYASQPVGIAVSPLGEAVYVTLRAVGKLLKLEPTTGDVVGEVDVGPEPRGIAVSHDGTSVYVTRFISPDTGGEVVKVDAGSMTVAARIVLALDSQTVDSDQRARGLPNYLFSIALAPDGRQAWVPGKKDNVLRGKLLDGQELTHDTTVRPLAAVIDLTASAEIFENRVDLDDRSMPVHVEFSPYGNLAILTLAGSNRIEIRDVNQPTLVFSAIGDVGKFPRGSVLAPNGRLFVQCALSREVRVYDLTLALESFDQSTPPELGVVPTVANERLDPKVLEGKRLFHDAEDIRMANEGYMTCGACHFDGMDDGRVYDFSTRGEGLRNTVSLLGHKGTGQGRLNWTATLDEIQDFEHQIRDLFGGKGFLPDDLLAAGTRGQPLGDPKAGLSPELDALAAYVTSLDRPSRSPFKNPDGTLTADGVAGKALFARLGCGFCHGGPELTDSSRGKMHDVGTITAASGTRAGAPLSGLDTPTLLGVWETPPYLHDGSAPTLRDVLTTKNPNDLHGYLSGLTSVELDLLVAYLRQLDGDPAPVRLPFEPPDPGAGGAGGVGGTPPAGGAGQGASAGSAGTSGAGTGVAGTSDPGGAPSAGNDGIPTKPRPSCGCRLPPGAGTSEGSARSGAASVLAMSLVLGLMRWRRRRSSKESSAARLPVLGGLFMLAFLAAGCGPAGSGREGEQGSGGTMGTGSPEAGQLDPELSRLGTRAAAYERLCSRGHADPFAQAMCAPGGKPEIRDMVSLLTLAGLADSRAFALTGNSTSLVAMDVTPVNPRIIVFPRVDESLTPPPSMTAVGFVRGEPFVEIVSRDPVRNDLSFYLVVFQRACDEAPAGCDLASRLTEEIERNWIGYGVYDHEDLEETSFDCLSCHRLGGQGTKSILRMQELEGPWMHWFPQRFVQRTASDRVLLSQFVEAHGGETQYGGIPTSVIANAVDEGSGAQLEALVRAEGFGEQPNPFDAAIADEMESGASPTWRQRFDAHLRGEAIAVPYPFVDVTDEAQRTAAVASYRAVVSGAAARETLLDLRRIFSADAAEKLSFVPQPGADGKTVLLQMCARCHDGRANPALRKSRFDVKALESMSRTAKDNAIRRINEPDATRMPPWRVGRLTPEAIQAVTAELQK